MEASLRLYCQLAARCENQRAVWWRAKENFLFCAAKDPSLSDIKSRHADLELAQNIVDGADDAFLRLIEQNKARVTRIASRFVDHVYDRDEVVSDVFADVYFSLSRFRGDSSLSTWISTIATRHCFQYLKKRERERKRRGLLQKFGWQFSASEDVPADHTLTAREQIQKLMHLLSAEDRTVLTLLYWEGCSVAEVADRLGWGQSKVKVRVHRARVRLRRQFEASS